jgi:protein phosphatase
LTFKSLAFKATGDSHVGRRENNEDVFFFTEDLFIVADGIGGHSSGEVAANYATASIEEVVRVLSQKPDRTAVEVLSEAISISNKIIMKHARSPRSRYRGMGTTVVALHVCEGKAAVGHAGDSRCYRLRNGKLKQLTVDHSEGDHRINRSLGYLASETGEIQEVDVQAGDVFLLCSDGLNVLTTKYIKKILKEGGEAEDLVRSALELGMTHQDNVTAIVVRVVEELEEESQEEDEEEAQDDDT